MRSWVVALAVATFGVGTFGCGGYADDGAQPGVSPAAPTSPAASAVVTIDVAEINGPYSFYPSPAVVQAGHTVVWRNSDAVTHHVVFDDDSIDTGKLAPGTLSQPVAIVVGSATYHCTIHPTMVGSVVVVAAATSGAR
jgi:plastocyanin